MKRKFDTKAIVTTGLLLALEIVFQVIGNYVQLGPVNINLSLVTIVLAAALCGPLSGAIVGFFNGILALFSPSTLAIFMPISPVGTVLACLLKCTIAGVLAGLVFNLLKKKNVIVGLIIASLIVPIVNTGIFSIFCLIFFRPFLESYMSEAMPNIGAVLIFGIIGWNFIFEIISTPVLSTLVGTIILKKRAKQEQINA